VNLGTAVVSGVWSPTYRYSRLGVFLLAAQGEGYIYESVLRRGRFSSIGLSTSFSRKAAKIRVFSRWTRPQEPDRVRRPPNPAHWSGVMDPYWDVSARGVTARAPATRWPTFTAISGITLIR
jgi:xylulokinase